MERSDKEEITQRMLKGSWSMSYQAECSIIGIRRKKPSRDAMLGLGKRGRPQINWEMHILYGYTEDWVQAVVMGKAILRLLTSEERRGRGHYRDLDIF